MGIHTHRMSKPMGKYKSNLASVAILKIHCTPYDSKVEVLIFRQYWRPISIMRNAHLNLYGVQGTFKKERSSDVRVRSSPLQM